jgi:hypothetical protein
MKNLLALVVFSIISVMTNQVIYAQEVESEELIGGINSLWQYHSIKTGSEEIKGNPFLFEDWNTKGVVYSEGKYFEVDKLNYNIYKEEIGSLKEKESVFVYETQYIDSVKIDKTRLHKLDGKFYVALQTGSKVSLFKKYETRIVDGMVNNMDGTKEKSRLVIMDDYYVLSQGSLKKFKPSKSSLEEVFGQQSPEMKKLMKAEKLNYKKENDLVSIFESYNGL